MAQFIPRATFPSQLSLPRSYYLGHHAAGLAKMKTMLSSIDLIIECRDYRVPLTSRNPLFEETLKGRERVVVYTKKDLGGHNRKREAILSKFHAPQSVLFTDHKSKRDMKSILSLIKSHTLQQDSLLGSKILVVGMPNVGKSSLLNALRSAGMGNTHKKAAQTGAQPGVTRKIAVSGVRIVEKDEKTGTEGAYLVDTPGVFIPFVPDAEAMLKLALVGSVKDTIIPPVTLCDYLLFKVNQQREGYKLYEEYCAPTNDIVELLEGVCRRTGRLGKGGVPDVDAAALWIIQRWRQGHLGTFLLDEVEEETLEKSASGDATTMSVSQAKKARKAEQIARAKARHVSTV